MTSNSRRDPAEGDVSVDGLVTRVSAARDRLQVAERDLGLAKMVRGLPIISVMSRRPDQ